jgi:hypothetical protein
MTADFLSITMKSDEVAQHLSISEMKGLLTMKFSLAKLNFMN